MAKPSRQSARRPVSVPAKPARSAAPKAAADSAWSNFTAPAFFTNIRLQTLLIFGFAFLLYANTLNHEFVLDDAMVINDNMYTKQGVKGIPGILTTDAFTSFFQTEGKANLVAGGRYRPFTLVIFALVYQLVGENAFAFHLLTVLLFAATCIVLYRTLLTLFRVKMGDNYAAMLAWLAALLFAAHPIHTEVVANVKGCDEIVTLLFSLGTLWLTLKAFDSGKKSWAIGAAAAFFLACLSKENAVTFLAVIPLALWFFRPAATTGRIVGLSVPLLGAFLVFFVIRGVVFNWNFGNAQPELMNNPFLKIEGNRWVPYAFGERLATNFYTLGKYIALFIFPHPLTHDYYPKQIPLQTFGNPAALLSLLIYLALGAYAVLGIGKKDPVRFGILFYLLTLSIVSNIFVPVGTSMGERFVFMPSVGFCLVAAALLMRLVKRDGSAPVTVPLAIAGVVALLFSLKTVVRNTAWASNEKLFFTDVTTSDNSAKIHNGCGGVLFNKAMAETDTTVRNKLVRESLGHANRAIQIYPNYKDAFVTRGACRYYLMDYDNSIADYRRAVQLSNNDPKIKNYLAISLRDAGNFYGEKKGDIAAAGRLLNESWQLNNQDGKTANLLGVVAGFQGKPVEALEWFKKAVVLEPNNVLILQNTGHAYLNAGDPKGQEYLDKAKQLSGK